MQLLLLFGLLYAALAIEEILDGGNCGEDKIPYRIEIKDNGRAVLSCTQPACLGDDYYSKEDLIKQRKMKSRRLKVRCYGYDEKACEEDLEWTGGLMEIHNGTNRIMHSKCCTYRGMETADTLRIVNIYGGENYAGGLVSKNNTVVGFNLIKEVKRMRDIGNRIKYVVTIARLPCIMDENDGKATSLSKLSRGRSRYAVRPREFDDYEEEEEEALSPRHPYYAREIRRRPLPYRRNYRRRPIDYDFEYIEEPEEQYARRPYPRAQKRMPSNRIWPFMSEGKRPRQQGQTTYSENNQLYNGVQDVVEGGVPRNELETMPSAPAAAKGIGSYEPPSYVNTDQLPLPPPNREELQSQIAPVPPPGTNNYIVAPPSYPETNSYIEQPVQARQPDPPPMPMPEPPVQMVQPQMVYQPAYNYYPAYPSYPAYSGGLNGFVNKLQCFSGDTEVTTSEGPKLMKDLTIGDSVLSMEENMVTFSPVIMFLHKLPEEEAEFLKIELDSGHFVKMTQDHLVYVNSCRPKEALRLVHAGEVQSGDCIFVISRTRKLSRQTVVHIKKVFGSGIYAPLTSTGDIFVNGMLASCHSNLGMKTLQQTFFTVYRGVSSTYKRFFPDPTSTQDLPLGVEYLTGVIDLFLPKSYL